MKGVLADRSNPYWEMMFMEALQQKWTNLIDGKLVVNWKWVFIDLKACNEHPIYDPFHQTT